MEKQFELVLTNRQKATLLFLGTFGALVAICVVEFIGAGHHNAFAPLAFYLTMLGMCGLPFLLPWLAKSTCSERVIVSIDAEGISIQRQIDGRKLRVDYAHLGSFISSGGYHLKLNLKAGNTIELFLNQKLQPQGMEAFSEMEHFFRWSIGNYQNTHSKQSLIEKAYFIGERISTVWLWILAALLILLIWGIGIPPASEGGWGLLFFGCLIFTIYALMWYHHRAERR